MYEFSISLTGDRIDAKKFVEAVSNTLKLLKSIEQGQEIRWRLATLRYNSPAMIGFVGEPRRRQPSYQPEDVGSRVIKAFKSLEHGRQPRGVTDESLEVAKKLAELRGRGGIDKVAFVSQNGVKPVTLPVTQRTAATVDDLIGPKYESEGSIEGRLEVVSSHGGVLRCNVYERLLGKAVRCDVPSDRKDLRSSVLALFDQTVIASGIVSRDSSGQPRRIALKTIGPVLSEELPQSLLGIAPDFTDGLDSVEYIRQRWQQ